MENNIDYIQTVKLQENGYLVNGSMSVPNNPANRHYNDIQEWIALGNTPEPQYTDAELLQQAKDKQLQVINTSFDNTFSNGLATSILDANSVAITMDATYEDIGKLKDGYDLAVTAGVTDMVVRDFNNNNHTLALADVNTILLELGSNYQTQLNKLWGYKDSINIAATITEVEAVQWV